MRKLEILGPGCPKWQKLAAAAKEAAESLGIEYEIEKVAEIGDIVKFGVMMRPALAVDGEVKMAGSVPDVEAVKSIGLTPEDAREGVAAMLTGADGGAGVGLSAVWDID